MKKKMSQPKTEPKTIEYDKASCCENCGSEYYYVSSEMGISHRRFRLCTKCMNELLSSAMILIPDFYLELTIVIPCVTTYMST